MKRNEKSAEISTLPVNILNIYMDYDVLKVVGGGKDYLPNNYISQNKTDCTVQIGRERGPKF